MANEIKLGLGIHISTAAQMLVEAAWKTGDARGTFNDITLTAARGETADDIIARYNSECEKRAEAYRRSRDGIKAAEDNRLEIQAAQATHDRLIIELATIDWSDRGVILDWICAMQGPSDRSGVNKDTATILATFAQHGYRPGVNCDEAFKPGDADNEFHWLVGQALATLQLVAIHGVVHKFAADWKSKYLIPA